MKHTIEKYAKFNPTFHVYFFYLNILFPRMETRIYAILCSIQKQYGIFFRSIAKAENFQCEDNSKAMERNERLSVKIE